MPEAATPDLSDVVSASDAGQDSMLANYGDGSGDQCALGKRASALAEIMLYHVES